MFCDNVGTETSETTYRQCLLNDYVTGLGEPVYEHVYARTPRNPWGEPADGYGLDEDGNYPEED